MRQLDGGSNRVYIDCSVNCSTQTYGCNVRNEFTAVIERDGDWYIAFCPEIPGANGQGHTKEESRSSLIEAIALILDDRREDGLRGVPPEAERETIVLS